MLENIITSILKNIFPDTYKTITNRAKSEGYQKYQAEVDKKKELNEEWRLKEFDRLFPIDGLLIGVPNEHENIVVGKVLRYDYSGRSSEPMPIVYDYVSKQELFLMTKIFVFNEELLKGLSKLTPQERHILIYGHEKDFKQKKEVIPDYETMVYILKQNGFYNELEQKGE